MSVVVEVMRACRVGDGWITFAVVEGVLVKSGVLVCCGRTWKKA